MALVLSVFEGGLAGWLFEENPFHSVYTCANSWYLYENSVYYPLLGGSGRQLFLQNNQNYTFIRKIRRGHEFLFRGLLFNY